MSWSRRLSFAVAVALAAAGLDQASKWLMLEIVLNPPELIELTPFLNLRLGFNTGVSFGLFRDTLEAWPGLLGLFKFAAGLGLLAWAAFAGHRLERIGLALMAGGAFGNAIDRWRQGAVTDFLDLHWGDWHWPTFNGADIALSCGVALMLLAALPVMNRAPAQRTNGAS
ncbi:Lipoprotein signal peptidase [Bosea sp. 62]|uniref:signal peptidase II n=1 Tax=unclassified Bosea (in: a-proteobacteria) TaxID=2653178 RepID=UPI00125B99A2|nr:MULTISPECIES: signal peptidase II [unclassified Bosea (in: a-proteobacteria)]CAD5289119.1 Lipoprotein signal peptidase [Bosea sp. 21B]CAD5291459.1 Lipoprotein signal peptidase [Bosea sp. 46]CAD5300577.1 Lipoprotein signal peptidase [Bosea sp. 7B]VVT60273.1 Lipoprotein signal peptidase [Bosea sp. EC-HK365B]VXA93628.1 Lipoprotein signal peptidase [Bosea sp. 62]